MASDWLGMFMLGYITPGGKVGEAMAKDIENFKRLSKYLSDLDEFHKNKHKVPE